MTHYYRWLQAHQPLFSNKAIRLIWVKNLNTVNSGTALDWATALTTADAGTWCNYTDWRMPNINELYSLVNYAYANQANWLMYGSGSSGSPACNGACFANVSTSSRYWSSSIQPNNSANVMGLNMTGPSLSNLQQTSSYMLFPVRGGQ